MAERSMNTATDPEAKLLEAQLREAQIFEEKITLALETAPRPEIPPDFAAKIAAQMPPLTPVTLTPRGYGRNAALISQAVLLALIVVFAHRSGASPLWTSMEWIFCAQFALVAVWLAVRPARLHLSGHF
jgi:hypothetical protein